MNTISITEAIGFGWESFKKRPWFFIGVAALIIVINWVTGKLAQALGSQPGTQILGTLVNLGIGALLGMGITHLFLKAHDAVESANFEDLWYPKLFLKYLITLILYGLVMCVAAIPIIIAAVLGFGALVSAGFSASTGHVSGGIAIAAAVFALIGVALVLYISSVFMFAPYEVVDKELGPIEAMKASKNITKGHRGAIIGFIIVSALVMLLGFIALFVGTLVALPVVILAIVHIYRKLSGGASQSAAHSQTPTM